MKFFYCEDFVQYAICILSNTAYFLIFATEKLAVEKSLIIH